MTVKKNAGYEYLRILATIAVVTNHVCSGLFNNLSIDELGRVDAAFLHATFALVTWAVPVFLMITGALLLNPEKELPTAKLRGYILRMVTVLLTFGGGYAVLELLFNGAPISLSTILRGYLNMLEGNSWAHMWYVYLLISLYIITPALKAMIKGLSKRQFELLAASLVVGHIGVDTINDIFHTQLYGYMQFSRYLMYYLIGYYVTQYVIANMEQKRSQWLTGCAVTLVLSSVMRYGLVLGSVLKTGELSLLGFDSGILEFMQVLSLFCLVCLLCSTKTALPSVCRNLARCSFSIYLVHPVFINLFYKAAGITPQVFPICIGIMVMLLVFFALSWVTANVMVRIPILKKIL